MAVELALVSLVLLVVHWGAFVVGSYGLAMIDPDRFVSTRILDQAPFRLRLPWFGREQRRLEQLGFREIGVLRSRVALWTLSSRISWHPELHVYAWTFSFLGSPKTGFSSVLPDGTMVDTGVSDRSPNWQSAVAHSGFQGSLAGRLAHHEARVSDLRRAHALLDQPPVAGGTMLAWKVLHDVIQRNQLRPGEARPYGAG